MSLLQIVSKLVLSLVLSVSCITAGCPASCQICTKSNLHCVDIGLTSLPEGIPLSVRYIDLSDNPHLKLKYDSFERFFHLQSLLLRGCALAAPILLPSNLDFNIDFSFNFLSINAVHEIFEKAKTRTLREIKLNDNRIELDGRI